MEIHARIRYYYKGYIHPAKREQLYTVSLAVIRVTIIRYLVCPTSDIAARLGPVAGGATSTVVFARTSLVAVDITADDMSELSVAHERCLGRGGSNGERSSSSFADETWYGGVS